MSDFCVKTVGIALAAYKPDPGIFAKQLLSIQAQSWTNWVCVITADSSLEDVFNNPLFTQFRQDNRFIWIENDRQLGHKKNFEKAIQTVLSHGVDAIACSDQDDIWYPDKIRASVHALEKAGPLSLVHCDMHIMTDGKLGAKTAWTIEARGILNCQPHHLLIRNIVAGCSMLFDAELARRFPIIPNEAEFHDHWYALVASFFGGVHPISQPLYIYRQHESNEVGVSPFVGRFALRQKLAPRAIIDKCRKGWIKSMRLASAAMQAGLPLGFYLRVTCVQLFDLAFGILLLGFINFFRDPPLCRACLARAAGKAFYVLIPEKVFLKKP